MKTKKKQKKLTMISFEDFVQLYLSDIGAVEDLFNDPESGVGTYILLGFLYRIYRFIYQLLLYRLGGRRTDWKDKAGRFNIFRVSGLHHG
jgi:hypothetical protein